MKSTPSNLEPSPARPSWLPAPIGSLLLGVLWLLAWGAGLQYRSLGEPDEGRYAEIAREMLVSHDWVTPRLDGFTFFDKPPLHYWASATAYLAFGVHPWSARLWCVLTGLLTMLAVGWAGARLFGREVGGYAMVILGSSLVFAMAAHIDTLDIGVAAFLGIGMAFFMVAQFDPSAAPRRTWLHVLMWTALALAILSKGLIGVVLPGLALVVFALWQRDLRMLWRTSPWIGLLVIAVVAAPWFVLICRVHPEFFDYFFIREHFTRFLTSEDGRNKPAWFFLVVVVLGLFPWTPMLPWRRSDWKVMEPSDPARRFLLVWVAVTLLFFSASHSKLTFYVLPLWPAAALLLAWLVARMPARSMMRRLWWLAALAGLAALALLVGMWTAHYANPQAIRPALLGGAAGLAIIALAALAGSWAMRRDRRPFAIHLLALSSLLAWQLVLVSSQSFVDLKSAAPVAEVVKAAMGPNTEIFVVRAAYQGGLPFYIGRLVTVVDVHRDDLTPGLAERPQGYIADLPAFETRWKATPDALAVVKHGLLPQLRSDGLPFEQVAPPVGDLVVIRRTPPATGLAVPAGS
ncbi:MAG: glycosyltransferase family 39 protein [Xanthomonadaceae bacterium]|nr:glycosyltransferase family 39 protein [Xanthomonadaceae bacterium]